MPTVGVAVVGLTVSAGHAWVERNTAIWPPSADLATMAPGPVAIVCSPVRVTRLSRWCDAMLSRELQVLTASVFPEPTTPEIHVPEDNPPSGSPSSGLVKWLVSFP